MLFRMNAAEQRIGRIAPAALRLQAGLWDMATGDVVELSVWFAVCSLLRRQDPRSAARCDRIWAAMTAWRWKILERNTRTYGMRRMGIRQVGARDGSTITMRIALRGFAWTHGLDWMTKQPFHRAAERQAELVRELEPEVARLEELHAGDRRAGDMAVMRLYKSRKAKPFLPLAYGGMRVAVWLGPWFLNERHRRQLTRITGTTVVVDND
jgi:hypothetical protein